jgi:hypothetical protein
MRLRSVLTAALALALTVAWAARKPGDPLHPGFNLFSRQDDVKVGEENAKQVLQKYEVVKNPFVQEYVQRLGQKLASMPEAKQSGFDFRFTVLNVDEINAFALPGGPMFIYTGLLKAVDNEAQLAGVMGHEMSHVILRHGTHEATKANGIQMALGGLAGLLGGGSDSTAGKLAQAGLGLTANSVILKFSRDAESEADALGSHLMSEAGYDPLQMAKFFEKLSANGQQGPQFLSDHPNPGNREAAIAAEMKTLPARQYGADLGGFARMKKEVAALPPPAKKPEAGALGPGSSVPTAGHAMDGFRRYQGKGYSLQYPDGWQVTGGDGDVTLAPRDGVVQQNGGSQVGFGVLIGTFAPQRGRDGLMAATDDLIRKLRKGNPKLRVSSAAKSVSVAGADGLVTMLSEDSPFGGSETDELATVVRPGGVMYFVFVAPDRDYGRVEKTFQQMLDSVTFE